MLTIQGKALGRKKPLFADWSVPFPPDLGDGDGGTLTLRDLIARIVRAEVEAFKERQQQRQLIRALTARDIQEGALKGKVDMGGHDLRQPVNEEDAVGVALQAFEDGLYLVILDEEEQKSLDAQVFLQPDSRITFVRLTMLAGG
jgi:hypothetical protein